MDRACPRAAKARGRWPRWPRRWRPQRGPRCAEVRARDDGLLGFAHGSILVRWDVGSKEASRIGTWKLQFEDAGSGGRATRFTRFSHELSSTHVESNSTTARIAKRVSCCSSAPLQETSSGVPSRRLRTANIEASVVGRISSQGIGGGPPSQRVFAKAAISAECPFLPPHFPPSDAAVFTGRDRAKIVNYRDPPAPNHLDPLLRKRLVAAGQIPHVRKAAARMT